MDPGTWGPKCWSVLLTAAQRLPTEESTRLIETMALLLPCVHCRNSFAVYSEELVPSVCIAKGDNESAMRYVWCVKDRVNQKVQQATVPFSRVANRMEVFTQGASANDALDLLALISLQVETDEAVSAYVIAAPILCKLATKLDEFPSCDSEIGEHNTPSTVWLHALACRNALRRSRGMKPMSREEFRAQYEKCRAPEPIVPMPVKKRSHQPKSLRTNRARSIKSRHV